jgi:MoaA/NifB/PqqE/SkfB family radical SAM enzyme
MPLDYARKIADEISSSSFKSIHTVQRMEVSENGDALLNPHFIEILRYVKLRNPRLFVNIYTNFQFFTKDISEVVVRENLLDRVVVNVDGHDSKSYFKVKKIPYEVVKQNILDFLDVRTRFGSNIPLEIQAITFAKYVNTVYNKTGHLPSRISEKIDPRTLKDDFNLIKNQWRKLLNPKTDRIIRTPKITLWAERELLKSLGIKSYTYLHESIYQVTYECFIAPNGDWYAFCGDEKQELTFGNVIEKSINEVYRGEQRKRFIDSLIKGKFDEIGYPCS